MYNSYISDMLYRNFALWYCDLLYKVQLTSDWSCSPSRVGNLIISVVFHFFEVLSEEEMSIFQVNKGTQIRFSLQELIIVNLSELPLIHI